MSLISTCVEMKFLICACFLTLGDSVKLDESIVENELNTIGALVPNEKIKLAYKCGRDMVICTSKRMLYVDTQGFSGKRIEYLSMRYSCIKGTVLLKTVMRMYFKVEK